MNEASFHRIKLWFTDYTQSFIRQERIRFSVELKIKHTYNVVQEMDLLTSALKLNPEARTIGRIIALLHDIGRFSQVERYHTMSDSKSIDHAQLALEVIDEFELLKEFSHDHQRLINGAIGNHNKYQIESPSQMEEVLFTQLIRDADKLDIWRVFIESDQLANENQKAEVYLDLPETEAVNPLILGSIRAGTLAKYPDLKSRHDFRFLILAWVYDLNFEATKTEFRNRKYLPQIAANLPASDETTAILTLIEDFINL